MTRVVVELAGPAGAGKTTLVNALKALDNGARIDVPATPLRLALGALSAAPALAAAWASVQGRPPTRADLRSIGCLAGWPAAVRRSPHQGLWLLDHGPVFRLAALASQGPPLCRAAALRRWWDARAREWGSLLDLVVWLDAPDDVLVARIDGRDRPHRVRHAAPTEAVSFLTAYRTAYEDALQAVAGSGARVLRLDTSRHGPEELADLVLRALSREPSGRST